MRYNKEEMNVIDGIKIRPLRWAEHVAEDVQDTETDKDIIWKNL